MVKGSALVRIAGVAANGMIFGLSRSIASVAIYCEKPCQALFLKFR
jgi:hypothetical protein